MTARQWITVSLIAVVGVVLVLAFAFATHHNGVGQALVDLMGR